MLYELLARAPPDDAPVAAVESGEVVEALHVEGGRLPSRPNRGTPSRRGRGHLAGADTAAFGQPFGPLLRIRSGSWRRAELKRAQRGRLRSISHVAATWSTAAARKPERPRYAVATWKLG